MAHHSGGHGEGCPGGGLNQAGGEEREEEGEKERERESIGKCLYGERGQGTIRKYEGTSGYSPPACGDFEAVEKYEVLKIYNAINPVLC